MKNHTPPPAHKRIASYNKDDHRTHKPRKSEGNFLRCLLGARRGVSSKRFTLLLMCCLYITIVIANTFFGKEVSTHIIDSIVIIIGICLGSVAATNFIKNE